MPAAHVAAWEHEDWTRSGYVWKPARASSTWQNGLLSATCNQHVVVQRCAGPVLRRLLEAPRRQSVHICALARRVDWPHTRARRILRDGRRGLAVLAKPRFAVGGQIDAPLLALHGQAQSAVGQDFPFIWARRSLKQVTTVYTFSSHSKKVRSDSNA